MKPCKLIFSSRSWPTIQGLAVLGWVYGTAWNKQNRIADYAGDPARFYGIDPANHRNTISKRRSDLAWPRQIDQGLVTRDEFFLQSKFTFRRGQYHRLPYDPKLPVGKQIEQSFAI